MFVDLGLDPELVNKLKIQSTHCEVIKTMYVLNPGLIVKMETMTNVDFLLFTLGILSQDSSLISVRSNINFL